MPFVVFAIRRMSITGLKKSDCQTTRLNSPLVYIVDVELTTRIESTTILLIDKESIDGCPTQTCAVVNIKLYNKYIYMTLIYIECSEVASYVISFCR